MSEFLILLVAVWGASGVAVAVIFALDERSHRRSGLASQPADVVLSSAAVAARSKVLRHGDRALV
jgi:hypothetical protein